MAVTASAYALLQWACARVGAILVTLNPAYRAPELVSDLPVSILALSEPQLLSKDQSAETCWRVNTFCSPEASQFRLSFNAVKCNPIFGYFITNLHFGCRAPGAAVHCAIE